MFLPKFLTSKKLALLFLVSFFLFLFSSKPLLAFSTPGNIINYHLQFEQAVFKTEEMNLQSFVYETFRGTISSLIAFIAGCFTCPPEQKQTGMIQTVSFFIASIYASPPASGVQYLADLGNRIGIVKPAYAQGVGFNQMKSFLYIWKAFRDITYVFFVLIFIFIGFAIMFRVKISPQAVITIQSALPKIILGLVLVTFSYAIVGFLIDIMWVFNNLIVVIFKNIPNFGDTIYAKIILRPPGESAGGVLVSMLLAGLPPILVTGILTLLVLLLLTGIVTFFSGGSLALPMGIIDLVVILLIAAIFLIALIRILWALLKAYFNVVLALIFGPFQILVGILPGSNTIGSWFRNLIANLAVLPATLTMVILSGYLAIATLDEKLLSPLMEFIQKGASPDLIARIGTILVEMISQIPSILIMFFVSIGILLLTPKVTDMIQAFLAGKPFGYGAAIGEAMGPVAAPFGFGWRMAKGAGERYLAREVFPPVAGRVTGEIRQRLEERRRRQIVYPSRDTSLEEELEEK